MAQELKNMSRFVKIGWLSLQDCCNKELTKLPSLKSMFLSRTNDSLAVDEGNADEEGEVLCIIFGI